MPKCTVCTHPDLQAIDQALLARTGTLEALSRQFGPSISALHRHKNHLQEKISQARRQLDNNLRLGLFFKLNCILERTEAVSAKAEANDNIDQVLKAARVSNRIIRDLGKMETSWDGLPPTASWPRPMAEPGLPPAHRTRLPRRRPSGPGPGPLPPLPRSFSRPGPRRRRRSR